MRDKLGERFEAALEQLNTGLHKKGCTKKYEKVIERLGRLKEKHQRVAYRYQIDVIADDQKQHAVKIKWKQQAKHTDEGLGVYCLRSNILFANELYSLLPLSHNLVTYHPIRSAGLYSSGASPKAYWL